MRQLSNIKVFSLIAEEGAISRAARLLNISVATASAHLDALERHLGGKLFIRSTRQLVLTDLGRLYLEHITPILDGLEVANQLASEFNATPQGTLRVTTGGPIGRRRIAPLVAQFLARHPDLDVFLNIDDDFRALVKEQFHVAIRAGHDHPNGLIQRKIASNRRVLVASPDYLAEAPPLNSPDDLRDHSLLLFARRHSRGGTMRFSMDGETHQMEFESKMTSDSHEALMVWLMEHCGIAQKSFWEVADALAEKKLVRLLTDFEPEPIDLYAVSPFRSGDSVKVDTFVSFLRDAFVKTPLC